jgi:hypothetical protein
MQAIIDTDVLQEAIRIALRLSPPSSGNITLQSDGQSLRLYSTAELSNCAVLLPCAVKGKAIFAIPTDSLIQAAKGHTKLEMVFDKTMLKLKSGRYSASLTTVDAIQIDEEANEEVNGKSWKITVDQLQWLKQAVAAVALKPVQNITTFMPISVKLTSKSAFVSCYDENHMSFVNSREITGDMELTLPIETITAVLDTFNRIACRLTVTNSALIVRNKLVNVSLALPETNEDSSVSSDMVLQKARSAMKEDGMSLELDKKGMIQFLDNCRAISTKERPELMVMTEPGKIRFLVKTDNGVVKTYMKSTVKKTSEFKVDFEFFDEAVRKCGDTAIFKVVSDSFLAFKTKSTNLLMSLNQE